MSPIKLSRIRFIATALMLLLAAACSDVNKQSVLDADTGEHPANWVAAHPAAYLSDSSRCNGCHVSDRVGGISGVSCGVADFNGTSCHGPGACTTCHESPPNGTAAPNRAGAHTAHYTAALFPDGCNTCHSGAGIGMVSHANGTADVSLLSTYNAKSGAASRNADGSCSKVSCHGGKAAPAWLSGSINVDKECTRCHASGTDEYNSFSSGEHNFHVNSLQFECTICHDTVKLAEAHFTALNTAALEGPASATLNSSLTYSNGSCSPGCHATRPW